MRLAGMILAAGLGSRMGALTEHTPKPLLEVAGEPLLGHLLRRMAQAGVTEIHINVHHRAERIRQYLGERPPQIPVTVRYEPQLTGPAGALRLFRDELLRHDAVLVSSADVIVGEPLDRLVTTHRRAGAPLTFACTRVRQARNYGVLDIGEDGDIHGAREKPDVPDDEVHWISAGVYCLDPAIIDRIPPGRVHDYAKDLAPGLIADGRRVTAHRLDGYWRDVGNPQALTEAREDAAQGRIPWLTTAAYAQEARS